MPGLSCGMQDLLVAKYGLSAAACGIQFLDQGSNSSPLHWKHGVLAMGTLGKSKMYFLKRAAEEALRQTHREENKVQTGQRWESCGHKSGTTMPAVPKRGKREGTDFLSSHLTYLAFRFMGSRTSREPMAVVLSHQVAVIC